MSEIEFLVERLGSPVGDLLLVRDGEALCALEFADHAQRMRRLLARRYTAFRLTEGPTSSGAATAVRAYFEGDRQAVAGLPADGGGTGFQRRVW